ncbi:uncharacterized protein LOC143277199 [Babylonia areolata]|uniref:uncharacterized protein LOC143277199 n=1 Tax=Babylonia areolata TaxID=304850 RepID=UPI003FD20B42
MERGPHDNTAVTMWRHRIEANWEVLVTHLDLLGDIMDHLISCRIFTSDDADHVHLGDTDRTNKATNRRFLHRLLKKGPAVYQPFIEALEKTRHDHLVHQLESTDMGSSLDRMPSSPPLSAADDTDGAGMVAAGGLKSNNPPPRNIRYVENLYMANTQFFNTETASSGTSISEADMWVTLIKEELGQCPEKKEALRTLEQKICEKIRVQTKKHFSSFREISKISFKEFIEQKGDHFQITNDGQHFIVTLKKARKKKKKKAKDSSNAKDNADGSAQQRVQPSPFLPETSISETPLKSSVPEQMLDEEEEDVSDTDGAYGWETVPRKQRSRSISKVETAVQKTTDEVLICSLIQKPASDSLIFRGSDDAYKHDRVEFIKDVTSLYNIPKAHCPAYIILGVQTRSSLPHKIQGLRASTPESVYQSMFPKNLFRITPKFRYREVSHLGKPVGIVEVDSRRSHDPPSIVISDDMKASGLRKNQLLSRENGKNVCTVHGEPPCQPLHEDRTKRDKGKQETPIKPTSYAQTVQRPTQQAMKMGSGDQIPASLGSPGKAKALMKALNNFQKFDFVLITGSMCISNPNVKALALAPWVAVYDFNFLGRDTGLLSMLEEEIGKRRSFSIFTWCDNCKGITEKGTQWWSLLGRREISESHSPDTCQKWFAQVKDKLEKLCSELAHFAEDCTVLKVLILWPDSELEARCMHKFLTKLQENLPSKMVLCFPDSTKDYSQSKAANLLVMEYEEEGLIEKYHVPLEDFCAEVELTQQAHFTESVPYQLPSSADSKVTTLHEKDIAWLAEDLDVLYLQNPHSEPLPKEHLEEEADTFFKGGSIKWSTLYDPNYKPFDTKRSVAKDIKSYIKKEFITDTRNGMVTIYHAPGAGGSTMARRVLWEMHTLTPCVHVKQRSGSSMEEIAGKLIFLYDKCRMPVITLMDGEDERKIKQFSRQLERHNVVIVCVKRYPYKYSKESKGKFYLPGSVKKKESDDLVSRYMDRCEGDETKIEALRNLDRNVRKDIMVQMYEFGMTVYLHEFQGVRAFVRGHLHLEEQRQGMLEVWQKCLGFLSLVYYYGQCTLPCQFFASLLGKMTNYKVDLDDFPNEVKVFLVQDQNEGREHCIRIGHYIIAQEILEQILNRRVRSPLGKHGRTTSDRLSSEARRYLKDFCIELISQATKRKMKTSVASQTITRILTRTFIIRDDEETSDMGEQGLETQQKKKPQFSQIMSDLDSDPPYQGRLEILQKLCETFPQDPNFRAHLGRFYTCCRPEEEKEAEKHFQEALKLCKEHSPSKDKNEIEDKSNLTLMHVYHMYGMFFQVRVNKLINTCSDLKDKRQAEEMFDVVIDNAARACDKFDDSRNSTPAGHEESYIYTNEIYVRLRTCDFVHRYFPGGMGKFLAGDDECKSRIKDFVAQSVTEIDNLIMECNDMQGDEDNILQKYAMWFHTLFSTCSIQLQRLVRPDSLANLRLTISATKLKFREKDDMIWTDSPIPEPEITRIVDLLENIFKEFCTDAGDRNRAKGKLDLDYRDWVLAIRHVNFKKVYKVEKVLEHVRQWNNHCHSPLSTYYLFLLLTLLGIGMGSCPGNTECLVEAQMLLEPMQKRSKVIQKSRFPREWLGREEAPGIKRLVTNSNISHEDRRIKNSSRAKLAVCKGTIRAKFQKLAGFIDLDLGLNATPVKVFFIPARAENVEPHHAGARVQFHLAFTLDKGYEAYEVKLLNRYQCLHCPQSVEMTWEQQEVSCPSCRNIVTKNEHSLDLRRTVLEGEPGN